MPLICGGDVLDGGDVGGVGVGGGGGGGGDAATGAVGAEVAVCEPFLFEAVTETRKRAPRSAATSTYVLLVALEIGAQLAPNESQRSH